MNILSILKRLKLAGIVSIEHRDVRGWSAWHQHHLVQHNVPTLIPLNRDAFCQAVHELRLAGASIGFLGGGTSTARPVHVDVTIDVSCLNTLYIDNETDELVVGAGITIDVAEAYVAERGWTIGQWLGSGKTATVGGTLATGARGLLAGRYGDLIDAVSGVELLTIDGSSSWGSVDVYRSGVNAVILSARIPLWLNPDGRAVATFHRIREPFTALRQIAQARLMPALISADSNGVMTVIVEGDPHFETARYQLIAAILQKHGGEQDTSLDQSRHWEDLLAANPWRSNSSADVWSDRITFRTPWADCEKRIEQWTENVSKAGGAVSWQAMYPTPQSIDLVFQIQVPIVDVEPYWIYETNSGADNRRVGR